MIIYTCVVCGMNAKTGEPEYTCDECTVLVQAATSAISVARRIGVPRYGSSSWRDVLVQEHLEHASRHVYQERKDTRPYDVYDSTEDHLAHAICRLAMAKALQDAK